MPVRFGQRRGHRRDRFGVGRVDDQERAPRPAVTLQRLDRRAVGQTGHAHDVEEIDAVGDRSETEVREQRGAERGIRGTEHGADVAGRRRVEVDRGVARGDGAGRFDDDERRAAVDHGLDEARVALGHRQVLERLDDGVVAGHVQHVEAEAGRVVGALREADAIVDRPVARRARGDVEGADRAVGRDGVGVGDAQHVGVGAAVLEEVLDGVAEQRAEIEAAVGALEVGEARQPDRGFDRAARRPAEK